MAKVSVLIPSLNEPYLSQTVEGIFAKATGDIEVVVYLDGYQPHPPLRERPSLRVVYCAERKGMRNAINTAAAIASGDFIMKLDAHCALSEGFDEVLQSECDEDWVVIPRHYRLDVDKWDRKLDKVMDYYYLYPPLKDPILHQDEPSWYFRGCLWSQRTLDRAEIMIDDQMTFQGATWFTSANHFWRTLGPLDARFGTLLQEAQEIGMKTWLSGGRMIINKNAWYAHWHKQSRGYPYPRMEGLESHRISADYWMNNRWPQRVHDFEWLVDHFAPVPFWKKDWKKLDWTHMLEREVQCQIK